MRKILFFIIFFSLGFTLVIFVLRRTPSPEPKTSNPKIVTESPEFTLEKAPSTSLHADITLLSGDIKWQSRIATEASAIFDKQQIQQGESLTTGSDGNISLAFPNMFFKIFPNSKINIIQSLPTSLVVGQTEGQINYQTTSVTPLSIRIYPLLIVIKNGDLLTEIDSESGIIMLSVASGSATVAYNDSDNISTLDKIQSGDSFIFDISTRTSVIK